MEKLSSMLSDERLKALKQRLEQNKGVEYRFLWVRVSHAAVKDGYIRVIGARAFGVFMVIRSYADKDGFSYPSLRRIAHLSGCSVRTVQKEIDKLIKHGWIEKAYRIRHSTGKYGNTKYRILQQDLIRGSGQAGFIDEPVANYANGD